MSSGRTKGVPQSFGYVKRSNGTTVVATQADIQQHQQQQQLQHQQHQQQQHLQQQLQYQQQLMASQPPSGRTAHVSAVPRSGKIKVSGGTQTCSADLQNSKKKTYRVKISSNT